VNVTLAIFELGFLLLMVAATAYAGVDQLIGKPALAANVGHAITPAFCCAVSYYYNDLYNPDVIRNFKEFCTRLLWAITTLCVLLLSLYTAFPHIALLGQPFLSTLAVVPLLLLSSVPLRWIVYKGVARYVVPERVIILGRSYLASELANGVHGRSLFAYRVIAALEDPSGGTEMGANGRIAPLPIDQLRVLVERERPDRIVVAATERRGQLPLQQLLEFRARGIVVEDGIDFYERLTGKLPIELLRPSALLFSKDLVKTRFQVGLTRFVGFALSICGLVLLTPLFLVIAVLIRLESPGPVFFLQRRVGRHGKHFSLIKFRTMLPSNGGTSEWECDNLERITRVGYWLRKFRLDEMPQLFNVVTGDMNLVGPRPHPVSNYELFVKTIPYYSLRSMVRPGITGWAQVRFGYANNLEEETEKMRYDLYYIKNMSIRFDVQILLDTVKTVMLGLYSQTTLAEEAKSQSKAA
jgi:exopolysaccharide biosynthesis polyprenyl glycosylphosphotransferase